MSNQNKTIGIQVGVSVYKDAFGFFPTPQTRQIQCGYAKVSEDTLSTIYQTFPDCNGRNYIPGQEVPESFPNSVKTVKLKAGPDFLWISEASYTAYLEACDACCTPNTLDAPANFVATPGDGEVDLDWDAVTGADNYIIERDTDINFGTATQIYSGALLTYNDATAVNDTQYYYRVKAQGDNYLDSAWSIDTATPVAPALAQPANFVGTPGDTTASLDWDNVANATNYVVERDTDSDFASATEVYSGATSSFADSSLTNGTPYYYRVRAEASGYNDSPYAYVTVTPSA